MKYVKIEDSKIVWGPGFIPKSWKNISGFHNLSPESLKELGWLPFIDAEPPYPNFIKLNVTYEINEENVVEKCEFQEVIPTEPEARDQ